MFNVFVRKVGFLTICGLLLGVSVMAQKWHHFDRRKFNLGFSMGLSYNSYKMTSQINAKDLGTGEVVRRVKLTPKPGIYLGLITNFKVSNNFDIRFVPNVTLEERDFRFLMDTTTIVVSDPVVNKKIEASNLNLPLTVKFKSDYYQNVRVYIALGGQLSINMASTKKVLNDPDLLKTERVDWAGVAAFGIDLYGEKLKLTPEIKYTLGARNIYVPDNTRFSNAISNLFNQTIVFSINFE